MNRDSRHADKGRHHGLRKRTEIRSVNTKPAPFESGLILNLFPLAEDRD